MDSYVINLDRSPERWQFMQALCADRGLDPVRVPAVDGATLTEEELECVSPAVDGARRLAAPEIACFESHRKVWRLIAESESRHGCVLEDDVYLAKGFVQICERVLEERSEVDLVKLNSYDKPIYLADVPDLRVGPLALYRLMQRTIDASAYLMSRECARFALEAFPTYQDAVDILLFDPALALTTYQAVPGVAVQAKFAEFEFLDPTASASLIQPFRSTSRRAEKRRRERKAPSVRMRNELRRFWRRRFVPGTLFLTNRFRRRENRMSRLLISFVDL